MPPVTQRPPVNIFTVRLCINKRVLQISEQCKELCNLTGATVKAVKNNGARITLF